MDGMYVMEWKTLLGWMALMEMYTDGVNVMMGFMDARSMHGCID